MNIIIRQITFKSTNLENTIFGWIYIPADLPRGIVQIIHGMNEHMGRYHDFMRYLAQNGYAACGIDQIGHGRSAEDGPYGFFGEKDGWKTLVDDQYKFHRIACAEVPECTRSVLLGHSMGSFIARLYAARYGNSIDGLILSGTARGGVRVPLAIQAAEFSVRKHGPYFVDQKLNQLVRGRANSRFKPNQTDFDWLTKDTAAARAFQEDPSCNFVFTSAGFRDLFVLLGRANAKGCFEAVRPELPVLLFSGTDDPVGEFGKGPTQVFQQYQKAGVEDVSLTLYEGGRHEMLNETNRAEVYDDLRGWLDTH